jgi:FKBP-type peptidyl-prolyl cis-trans isomerase
LKSILLFIVSLLCICAYSAENAEKVVNPELAMEPQMELEPQRALDEKALKAKKALEVQKALEAEKALKAETALEAEKVLKAKKALEAEKALKARKALEAKKRALAAEKAWKAQKARIKQSIIKKMGAFKLPAKGDKIKFRMKRGSLVQGKFDKIKKNKVFIEIQSGVTIGFRISEISEDDIWKFDKKKYGVKIKNIFTSKIARITSQKQLASSLNINKDKPAFSSFNFGDSRVVTNYKIKKKRGISYKDMDFEDVDPQKIYCQTTLAGKECDLTFSFNDNDQLEEVALYFEGHPEADYDSDLQPDWESMRQIILKKYKKATTSSEFPKIETLAEESLTPTETWELKNKRISVGILFGELEYKSAIVIEDTTVIEKPKAPAKAKEVEEETIDDADKF